MVDLNTLIKNKKPEDCTIVVGMSGGVDSSVVAALLKKHGYNVVGVTLKLWNSNELGTNIESNKVCGSEKEVADAKTVCEKLNIKHIVLNYEEKFKVSVIDDFVNTYAMGCTPIPCIKCNSTVKFKSLIDKAKELNADAVATGHYVHKEFNEELNKFTMTASKSNKDQSYFLFLTSQEQLDYSVYPLGEVIDKDETRKLAEELDLHISDKKDSQDICFIPDGDYRSLLKRQKPDSFKEGDFINTKGEKIGTHKGIEHYTVGQRKNLGISLGFPAFVSKILPETNQIVIGTKDELNVKTFNIKDISWLGETIPKEGLKCFVKVRSTHTPTECTLTLKDNNQATVELETPETMVSPGQAAVFYDGDRLLGGGWILNDTQSVSVVIVT
ncbi:MAG: tRNA 2-thiouridine(34) synthase MnmA [Proteobacteria bacterium]|nr:tRNA 2-thiouridine(34) synthase MnmA [Pseudomonadota bacterium]